ncbi:MAG: hypothetical protein U5M53_02210 [Rhodoferax sp.]|nr:hypothetical protein [Rhodoferax sp.]
MVVLQAIRVGLVGLLCFLDGSSDGVRIMAVDGDGVPVRRRWKRACWSVESAIEIGPSIEMLLSSQKSDELVQLEVAGERDGFLADAFHEAAVTRDARR